MDENIYTSLSPPQRLLLVNTRKRNGSGSGYIFPRRDCLCGGESTPQEMFQWRVTETRQAIK